MANTVKVRRSATPSAVPTTVQLALGEIAVNTYDGKMFIKKDVSGTQTIVEITAPGGSAPVLGIAGDTGTDNVTLGTDTLTFVGGTGITSAITNNTVTFDIDSTVATLTGTQTLTNKTLTSPTLTTPALGTPASGNFSTGTFTWPTFNQNTTGSAANVTGTVAVANGGTGVTTAQAAMNAFAGATTSGQYLRGNGTNVVMATIVAGDVPTLNQNTTGSSGSCTGNAATATTATNLSGGSVNATSGTFSGLITTDSYYKLTNSGTQVGLIAKYKLIAGSGADNTPTYFSETGLGLYFCPNGSATVAASLSTTGVFTATSFTGAGTGLTGTASSFSIGGNAATATTATNQSGGTVSATTGAFSGIVTQPKKLVRRDLNVASGIGWYDNTYSAWTQYMSPAAATGCGPLGNITAPSGTLVTSWALRSFIENSSTYGWTFESGTSSQTTPTVVAEIRASDGAARFAGAVTAASFSGPLTGNVTGSSASCSGNAATATTATNIDGGSARISSINGTDQQIENAYGAYLHIGGWAVGRTDATAVLVNTAYRSDICDGNAASATYAYNCNSWFNFNANYGHAVEGIYNSTIFQGMFDMGPAYRLTAGGGVGNLYGTSWSYPSAGGPAANLDSHGMLVLINGGFGSCMSYSIKASANVTAYSDERLKTNWKPLADNFVAKLAEVRVGTYDRTDQSITQVGVSAQSLETLMPEAVITGSDEMQTKSVAYGNAALASAVMLAKEIVEMKQMIQELKDEIANLKGNK